LRPPKIDIKKEIYVKIHLNNLKNIDVVPAKKLKDISAELLEGEVGRIANLM
jgi:hypothetical protein